MAIVRTDDTHYKNIANAIRAITGSDESMESFKPSELPDQVNFVFNTGKFIGRSEGETTGEATGREAQYNEFWDSYQNYGKVTQYTHLFAGCGWKTETFKPKYDMYPVRADSMFHTSGISGDLVEILDGCGIVLDTSNATTVSQMFAYAQRITRVGVINTLNCANLLMLFYAATALETIDELILKDDGTQTFSNTFHNAKALKDIYTITGVIGQTVSFAQSTSLTRDCVMNIIGALYDKSTEMTCTLSLTAVNTAFETSKGAADGSASEEWDTLVAAKSNWTITLV